MPGENNGVTIAKEAVQFSACFVTSVCQLLTKFVERQYILYFYCLSNTN